ncbi:GntR family transcriptional regulator [Nocardia sp. NPDC057353]|uniref:GntR family transcriptional regulator n=1 Tax=Nocardia sp. NPDC057353 TaxID=3346104 RepID=UPI0036431940
MTVPLPRPAAVGRHPRSVGGSAGARQRSARVVHQLLRSSIKSGILPEGEQLNEDALIERLDSTRASVRSALQMLSDEGLVTRRRRLGTVVHSAPVQLPVQDVVGDPETDQLEYLLLGNQMIPAHHLIKARMPASGDHIRLLDYLIKRDGVPIGTLVAFQVNPNVILMPHTLAMDHIAPVFELQYGRRFGRMETWIDAVVADASTARTLDIEPGSILLVRDQVLADEDGNIHEFAYAHYRADMVSFRSH